MKTCSKCFKDLPIENFYFEKTQNRFRGDCKKCVNKKNYKWKDEHIDEVKTYIEKNKEKSLVYAKNYREKNKQKINKQIALLQKERSHNDNEYRIRINLRSRIRCAIKSQSTSKLSSTTKLLGATPKEVFLYLESKWLPNMSWENYGFGHDKWNIDHIIPCASFDLTNEENQKKCFHYTNLQPLWQKDNFKNTIK